MRAPASPFLVACLISILFACSGGGGNGDNIAPTLSVTGPSANDVFGATPITVTGTASDDIGVTSITVNGQAATINGDSFTIDIDLSDGVNTLTVVARDAAGNSITQSVMVTFMPPATALSPLAARQVIPPTPSAATGQADLSVNLVDGTLTGSVTLTGMQATQAEIRHGYAGEKGALIVTLEQGADATQWNVPADTQLAMADVSSFEAGELYVLAVEAAPDDVIRGQLLPSGIEMVLEDLEGSQEVPEVVSGGTGIGAATVNTQSHLGQFHANVAGTASAVIAGHIHQAFAGHNGAVIIPFQEDMMVPAGDPVHWFAADVQLTDEQYAALLAGELYFNMHTPDNPLGELRGQVVPTGLELFFTDLSGLQVVGDGITIQAVNTVASAKASTTLDTAAQSLTVYVNTSQLDDAAQGDVTINQAPQGQNGPAVITLDAEPNDDDPGDNNVRRWFKQNQTLTAAQYTAFVNQGLYANVATPAFPVGEVRGQLLPPGSTPETDPAAFQVMALSFQAAEMFTSFPDTITVTFNKPVLAASLDATNLLVQASGGDMGFGDGNETVVDPTSRTVDPMDANSVVLDFTGIEPGDDTYRLYIAGDGADPVTDVEGIVFDGDANGIPGGDYQALFSVAAPAQPAPTLTDVQTQVFTPHCTTAGCHDANGTQVNLSLTAGNAYSNLVNVASAFNGVDASKSGTRVIPNDPDNSVLVRRLEGNIQPSMPYLQPMLDPALIQLVRDWISDGAQNN